VDATTSLVRRIVFASNLSAVIREIGASNLFLLVILPQCFFVRQFLNTNFSEASMAVNTANVSGRRELRFADFSQLLADAENVATHPCRQLGNWTVGQILEHLAITADCPFDGFGGLVAPWHVRYLIVPFVKNSFMTQPMAPGRGLPKKAVDLLVPPANSDPAKALEHLRRTLERYKTETPKCAHPALGKLAFQEWVALTLRHAELHLSFLVPE